MKKILWSAVLAVVLVAALGATSLAISVSGPETVETGDTVNITVTGEGAGISGTVETEGLTVTDAKGGFSTTQDVLLVDAHGGLTATYTCRVTAKDGERVSFNVTDVVVSDGTEDFPGKSAGWSARVDDAEPTSAPTDTQAPTSVPPAEPIDTDAPTDQPTDDQGGAITTQTPEPTDTDGTDKPADAGTQKTPAPSQSAADRTEHLPKTADSSLDLWTFLSIGAGLAVIIVIAGRKVYARL